MVCSGPVEKCTTRLGVTEANFDEVMQEAARLIASDPPAAIELLEGYRDHSQFFPWGAHLLMVRYLDAGRRADALPVAIAIGERLPDFFQAWWPQMITTRGTPAYHEVCQRVIDHIQKPDFALSNQLVIPFMEAVLTVRPPNAGRLAERFVTEKLLSLIEAFAITRTVDFLWAVNESYAYLDGEANFQSWNFGVYSGEPVLIAKDGVAVVNLSCLGVSGLEGWDVKLAERVTVATSAIMNWLPYCDERGTWSWPAVSVSDCFASAFWRLAFAPIEWLDLRRIDLPPEAELPAISRIRRIQFPRAGMEHGNGRLFVRPGNVEIWALWTALQDRDGAQDAAETVAELALTSIEAGKPLEAKYERPWTNAVMNITRLNTNAGWYAVPGRAAASFIDWADRYGAALCGGELLATHDVELLPVAALLPEFRHQLPGWWSEDGLRHLLDQARVVLVTAFAEDIQSHHDSGGLAALWQDLEFGVKLSSLKAVPAPMSVWPYYPEDSWTDSFERLSADTAQAIEEIEATTLIASCGSYGLPLVHEMHKRYRISSLYNGHQSNLYFGVVTNAGMQERLFARNPTSSHWLSSNITERFPVVSRIDDGRYISRKP